MNTICLVVDRLHAGYLGCYGNTWIATPEFNRLASESFLLDQALVDSPQLASLYRGYWQGAHALVPRTSSPPVALPQALSDLGIATTLITDDPLAEISELTSLVSERIDVPLAATETNAEDVAQTHLAGFFATALDYLDSAREPFCLWLHTGSLAVTWDAPLEFRRQYAEEDEPLPPDGATVPRLVLPPNYDPDTLLGYSQAYAGQVSLLDQCLGGLLEFLRDGPLAKNTLLVVLAARGIALGEHRRIGAWDEALCGELVHVPWLLRFPDGLGAATRSQALVQPPDLAATLRDWWQLERSPPPSGFGRSLLPLVRDEIDELRDRVCLASPSGEAAIRTPAWYLRLAGPMPIPGDEVGCNRWLYAKPDDRFELNNVAGRCPEIVGLLEQKHDELRRLESLVNMENAAPLEDVLVSGFG
jgi:arylsulfatase A-like enzyme